jgi:hypothetical protein
MAVEGCHNQNILAQSARESEPCAALKLGIANWVDNFRLDIIIDLTQASTNE